MWEQAENLLSKDKYIGPLLNKYGPCKIKPKLVKYYFDNIASSIIEQQLSGKAANAIYSKVKNVCGVGSGKLNPQVILSTDDLVLRGAGLSWAKVKYIKDLSLKVSSKDIVFKKLRKLNDEEVINELVRVKGIGRWTAEMFLMFTLGRPDIFPVDDLGIKNAMKKMLGKNLAKEKLIKFAFRWKPYRTVASWYIWRSFDNR